jgi:type I restriction enzyme, S subunit
VTSYTKSLPANWECLPLGKLADLSLGKMLDRAKRKAGMSLPYLRNLNVRWGGFDLSDLSEMPFEGHEMERYGLRAGDVLICEGGEPGRAAVWPGSSQTIMFQKAIHRARCREVLDPSWLVHQLRHDAMSGRLAQHFTGSTIKHFTGAALNEYEIAVPPIEEQRRIVAKLEAALARSRRAKDALDTVPALLESFRQSVLAAAFRGDLTRDWREQNPNVEPASTLLERIRAERRRCWEDAELERMRAKGRLPKDDHWKALHEEPEGVATSALPEGWSAARLQELRAIEPNAMTDGPFGSNLKTVDYVPAGVRVIRLGNLGTGRMDLTDEAFISVSKFEELRKHELFAGDLVIAALAEPLARCCQVPPELGPAIVKADCIRFKAHPDLRSRLIMHFLNSPLGKEAAEQLGHGMGRLRINMENLRALPVPVPPDAEQAVLEERIDQLLGQLNRLYEAATHAREQLDILDAAALSKAFRGELVPQDPADEPASVLLERIRAECAESSDRASSNLPPGSRRTRRTPRVA